MRPLLLAALVALTSGCDTASQYACTLEFRTVQVMVRDAFGRPVEGLTARSIVERGQELVLIERTEGSVEGTEGRYTVASDAHLDLLSIEGEDVIFRAEGPGLIAEARYVLADDGCHIRKEEGPAEITAVPR
ncbi:MAG: hypothetical protein AAGI52_18395 [Bacteroidota bacterium]